jgi:hypothetical protein
VVALFNGAEGDVSFRWRGQDRDELARLAEVFSKNVRAALAAARPLAADAISSSYDSFSIAHRRVTVAGTAPARTARIPMAGRATISGAEDGRNEVPHWIAHEGKHGFACGAHGTKIGAFDLAEIGGFVVPPLWPTRLASLFLRPESRAAVSVHRLGPVVLATLPGEFTTMMGSRIHAAVARAAAATPQDVVLVGLAQSYAYYFAAAEEYDAQHYEGSGTLWGRHAGALIAARLAALAAAPPAAGRAHERNERYFAGLARSFGPRFVEAAPDERESDLARVLGSGALARWCWSEPARRLQDTATAATPAVPRVHVEAFAGEAWTRVSWPQAALDTALLAAAPHDGAMCWCAYWRVPRGTQAARTFRFAVARAGAERACAEPRDCSPAFAPATEALYAACPAPSG